LTGISNKLKDKILKFLKKYPANDL
jgi:hypothetical protein